MKTFYMLIALIFLFGSMNARSEVVNSFQDFNTSKKKYVYEPNDFYGGTGLRVILNKSFLTGDFGSSGDISIDKNFSPLAGHNFGFEVGYSHLPVGAIGFIGALGYHSFEIQEFALTVENDQGIGKTYLYDDFEYRASRAQGNIAYTFTSEIHSFLGLNFLDIITGELGDVFGVGVGAQIGMGYHFDPRMGVSLAYTYMRSSADVEQDSNRGTLDLEMSGLELGLYGTF